MFSAMVYEYYESTHDKVGQCIFKNKIWSKCIENVFHNLHRYWKRCRDVIRHCARELSGKQGDNPINSPTQAFVRKMLPIMEKEQEFWNDKRMVRRHFSCSLISLPYQGNGDKRSKFIDQRSIADRCSRSYRQLQRISVSVRIFLRKKRWMKIEYVSRRRWKRVQTIKFN